MSVQRERGSGGGGSMKRSRAGPYSAADPGGTSSSDSPLCLIRFLCVREKHYDYLCEQRARRLRNLSATDHIGKGHTHGVSGRWFKLTNVKGHSLTLDTF